MESLYTAEVTSWGGRQGTAESSDGALKVTLATPKEMGGDGAVGTNPEQLFAAGYSACFHSAAKLIAGRSKLDVGNSAVSARVHFGKQGEGFGLAVELIGEFPGLDHAQATDLMAQAHEVCPYSNATRGNIEVTLTVTD